ncbi:uncharacterized protein LOC123702965 [Colias croceus]|uniref:uncharacterized protein LOC123702965 n=1 Tax=Colias crocea TaxID=72248 RepID=UPI001E280716|nr:uncharacterized protein LOC123702965 [Colias croceus]
MCEIFPEVDSCCMVVSLRVGMLFISVLCIMTGVITLTVMEQSSNINANKVQNVSHIQKPEQAVSQIGLVIPSGISTMATVFIITGLILLFATLIDDEGLVQVFVWLTFLAIVLGFVMVFLIACECLLKPVCFLAGMDWLSGSILLVLIVAYLFLWVYFISVANSYVISTSG